MTTNMFLSTVSMSTDKLISFNTKSGSSLSLKSLAESMEFSSNSLDSQGCSFVLDDTRSSKLGDSNGDVNPMTAFGSGYFRNSLAPHLQLQEIAPFPHRERIDSRCVEWALSAGIIEGEKTAKHLQKIGCGTLACYVYPTAPEHIIQLGADYHTWLWVMDDRLEGNKSVCGADHPILTLEEMRTELDTYEECLKTRAHPATGATVLHEALLVLAARGEKIAGSAKWVDHFGFAIAEYYKGVITELAHRRQNTVPSLPEYIDYRNLSGAAMTTYCFNELERGVMSDSETPKPILENWRQGGTTKAVWHANNLVSWINDLYSHGKEMLDGECASLIHVIAVRDGCSYEEAYESCVALFNAEMTEFLQHLAEMRAAGVSDQVEGYLSGLHTWVFGSSIWNRECVRYKVAATLVRDDASSTAPTTSPATTTAA